jgi:hypothetical protein
MPSGRQRSRVPASSRPGAHARTGPTLRAWLARLAAWQPFEEAVATLALLTGVQVSDATLERTAVAVGRSLGEALQQRARQHQQGRLPALSHGRVRLPGS